MNGGFLTNYFNISRGVRQGCPFSPSLFILAVELLALKILQDPNSKGIALPNQQEVKISQFADDTTIITNNSESLKPYLQTVEVFGILSGLKLNRKKTKAMWLGSMKDKNIKILEFKTTKEPVKVLGVHLSYDAQKCIEANFCTKINKMKMKPNLCLSRDLTFYGKSLPLKALGVSPLVHTKAEEGLPTSDFRLPTSDFRLPTSDFRLPTSDFRLPTSDFRLPTSDFRLPTSDFRLPTSDFLTSDFRSKTKFHIAICILTFSVLCSGK